jgi:citrate lyase subunit beta/citryl-CoA lyase
MVRRPVRREVGRREGAMANDLPVWRSLLYVPANVQKYVDRAHARGADAIQLDLEDSVPAAEKAETRKRVQAHAARVRQGGADVVVRINQPLALAVRDIEHTVCPDVDAIAIAKVAGASHVRLLDDLVSELELRRGMPVGRTRFITMIETADAFLRMREITGASARIVACNIGGEDFALDCNMRAGAETLLYPKQHMVVVACAAGILPVGFIDSVAGFGDWVAFRAMVRRSRDFGFQGAGCIHPGQVGIVNQEYTPAPDEVDHARRIIALDAEAAAARRASFALDGRMVDIPVVERARRLLRRVQAIEAREARTLAATGA